MKIRFLKNIDVNIDKTNLKEVWPRYIYRNDIYNVNKIETIDSGLANLVLDNNDVLLEVPVDSFQCIKK